MASQLIDDDQPTVSEVPALAASVKVKMKKKSVGLANKVEAVQTDLTATDVVAKPRKNAATKKTKVSKLNIAGASQKTAKRGSNPDKLFFYFERSLSPNEFSAVNQTAVSKATGIPMGSMTAAIKKLIESGRVTAAPNGSLKLAPSQPPVQA